jgi:hypothetical protein
MACAIIMLPAIFAERPHAPAHRVEQRAHRGQRLFRPRGHDVELPRGGHGRHAEHRRRNVGHARLLVQRRQFAGQRGRDGGHHHVHAAGPRRAQRARIDDHAAHGRVVGQHREHHFVLEGRGRGVEQRHALQRLGGRRVAVPHRHPVARRDQVRHHGRAHASDADECCVH